MNEIGPDWIQVAPPIEHEVANIVRAYTNLPAERLHHVTEGSHELDTWDVDDRLIIRFVLDGTGADGLLAERAVPPEIVACSLIRVPEFTVHGESRVAFSRTPQDPGCVGRYFASGSFPLISACHADGRFSLRCPHQPDQYRTSTEFRP